MLQYTKKVQNKTFTLLSTWSKTIIRVSRWVITASAFVTIELLHYLHCTQYLKHQLSIFFSLDISARWYHKPMKMNANIEKIFITNLRIQRDINSWKCQVLFYTFVGGRLWYPIYCPEFWKQCFHLKWSEIASVLGVQTNKMSLFTLHVDIKQHFLNILLNIAILKVELVPCI